MTAPTFPPLTPITCAVTVQGQLIADGSDMSDAAPTALSGLSVVWGRGSTVDQPGTATATFTIEDRSADQAFAGLVALGKTVQISATGTTYPAGSSPTFTDPGFDSLPAGSVGHSPPRAGDPVIRYGSASAVIETVAGGQRLRISPGGSVTPAVAIPPAQLADPANPAAWDAIPAARPGQTAWRQTIGAGWAAPGAVLRVGVAGFALPWSGTPAIRYPGGSGNAAVWNPAAGPWDLTYTPTAGEWQGTYVSASPAGYRWQDVPADISWASAPADWSWQTMAGFAVDDVQTFAPAAGTDRSVLVFAGRITDATAQYDLDAGSVMVDVIAADMSADLANRDVGAEPWPAETIAARAARIIAASGFPVTLYVDPRPAALTVTRMDVDRQQVFPMLADLATSADAVLWAAVHQTTGAYLWVEDVHARTPVEILALVGGVVVIVPNTSGDAIEINSCDVDLEPLRWVQTNADIATRAVVDWLDQTTQPDPTGRTVQVIYPGAEDPAGPWGVRRVQVSSQLTTATDATAVATGLITRLFGPSGDLWRIAGLTYPVESDADAVHVGAALTMLDGTTRIGAPVLITDLPGWSPIPGGQTTGYLEGGGYTYAGGAWRLELVLSSGAGLGKSIAWNELDPGWAWSMFDPGISWLDLIGVGADNGGTRP